MRHIGTIPDSELAARFHDYLLAQGTKCRLDDDADGVAVWVFDDDRVPSAKQQLAEFLAQPNDARYREARAQASVILKEEAAKRKEARRNTVVMSQRWARPSAAEAPITVAVLIACVFLFIQTDLMRNHALVRHLLFSTGRTWQPILDGEYWRIFTPALMHGGWLHIFFNLMWWWDLGVMIESRRGSLKFLLMVAVMAAGSNAMQFVMTGPNFLGLSGVVFGLFGYVWVKGKLDPSDGMGISNQTATWMLVWFVACSIGLVGQVANWAHGGGLVLGVIFGSMSALWRQTVRR